MVYVIRNYDLKLVDNGYSLSTTWRSTTIPRENVRLLVQRRDNVGKKKGHGCECAEK